MSLSFEKLRSHDATETQIVRKSLKLNGRFVRVSTKSHFTMNDKKSEGVHFSSVSGGDGILFKSYFAALRHGLLDVSDASLILEFQQGGHYHQFRRRKMPGHLLKH